MVNLTENFTVSMLHAYLQANKDIFVKHPELLDIIELNRAPEGTISLVQRQQQRLKEANKSLREQLQSFIDNAKDNVALQQRVHQLVISILDAATLKDLINILTVELEQQFAVDFVALRFVTNDDVSIELPKTDANVACWDSKYQDDLRHFTTLTKNNTVVCGRLTHEQKAAMFADKAEAVNSCVYLPLEHNNCKGLLVMGSTDANRFHADMGTDYLSFLAGVISRTLSLYITLK